jgi:hypothetical protein
MMRTRKVQVTLEEQEYMALAKIAMKSGKKLAAVVRESIRRYALLPEEDRQRREALAELLNLPPTPVPAEYSAWEQEYRALKIAEGPEKQ